MNKQVIIGCGAILITVATISFLTTLSGRGKYIGDNNAIALPVAVKTVDFGWESTLSTMSIYQTTKSPIKPVKTAKPILLSDAKLVAIISDAPKTAMLLIPDSKNTSPLAFKNGEGWLENWIITAINRDNIVWENSASGVTQTQYLYE